MALNNSSLSSKIVTNLKEAGFAAGEHAKFNQLSDAIAKAVIDEITTNAEVAVTKGNSAGTYKVS